MRRERIAYGPLWREVDLPGWYPEGEGDAVHSGVDLAEADRLYRELRKEYGAHVRKLRKRLKLSQEETGRIIGGGKRAFQKYESGATPPSEAAVGLMEVLARHPEAVGTLRAVRGGRPCSELWPGDVQFRLREVKKGGAAEATPSGDVVPQGAAEPISSLSGGGRRAGR